MFVVGSTEGKVVFCGSSRNQAISKLNTVAQCIFFKVDLVSALSYSWTLSSVPCKSPQKSVRIAINSIGGIVVPTQGPNNYIRVKEHYNFLPLRLVHGSFLRAYVKFRICGMLPRW